MKTPKRFICPVKDYLCGGKKPCFPWAERGVPDLAECARWKRKNKETQFKRTIARLRRIERRKMRQDKLLQLYRSKVSALKFAIKDADAALDHEIENSGFWRQRHDKLLFIAYGYCSASTCGHDIEGS